MRQSIRYLCLSISRFRFRFLVTSVAVVGIVNVLLWKQIMCFLRQQQQREINRNLYLYWLYYYCYCLKLNHLSWINFFSLSLSFILKFKKSKTKKNILLQFGDFYNCWLFELIYDDSYLAILVLYFFFDLSNIVLFN